MEIQYGIIHGVDVKLTSSSTSVLCSVFSCSNIFCSSRRRPLFMTSARSSVSTDAIPIGRLKQWNWYEYFYSLSWHDINDNAFIRRSEFNWPQMCIFELFLFFGEVVKFCHLFEDSFFTERLPDGFKASLDTHFIMLSSQLLDINSELWMRTFHSHLCCLYTEHNIHIIYSW